MSRYLKNPNLPESTVTELVCGGLNAELIAYLEGRGIRILNTVANQKIDKAVSKHCDLSVLYLGNGRIIIDRMQNELAEKLEKDGFEVIKSHSSVEGLYPGDCILNHTIVGKYIIGNSKIIDESVKKFCSDLETVHVNQGYCKCSVLAVDGNSVITDDESIARKASKIGLDCLLISKGDVFLGGHNYGFIGGASGKISKNEIIFFGDITKHRDFSRIKDFISKKGMEIIYFSFPLTDFGGIIPIKENIF